MKTVLAYLFMILAVLTILLMIASGIWIALESKAREYAEFEAERRYLKKIRNTRYRVHIATGVIDEMNRGERPNDMQRL